MWEDYCTKPPFFGMTSADVVVNWPHYMPFNLVASQKDDLSSQS